MDKVKTVAFDDIKLEGSGFENPRLKMDKTKVKDLANNIADRGLRAPLTLWECEDGLVLVGGHRRYAAIKMLIEQGRAGDLEDAVPYVKFEGDLSDARLEAIADNMDREDLSSYEMAAAVVTLLEEGKEQKEIAERLRRSVPWVSRNATAYRGAGKSLKKVWKNGELPLDVIMDIASLEEDEQDDAIDEQKALREGGGKKNAGKARKAAKARANKVERASGKDLQSLLVMAENAPEDGKYVHGMKDALRFALGLIGLAEFADPWQKWVAKMDAEARRAADAEEEDVDDSDDDDSDDSYDD